MAITLIAVLGLIMVFLGIRALALTFWHSTFRVRRNQRLRRKNHPIMFWANVAGIGIFSAIGLALIFWALSG